jgi:hypothetical protein
MWRAQGIRFSFKINVESGFRQIGYVVLGNRATKPHREKPAWAQDGCMEGKQAKKQSIAERQS